MLSMYCICKNLKEKTQSTRTEMRFALTLCVKFFLYFFMKYLTPIIITILLFSCEDNSNKSCAEQNLDEVFILDTRVTGISWFYDDNTCIVDSTSIEYGKWKQGRRFITEVNGEYFIHQTITNSNPVEYYVVDSLSLDWISFKGDSLFVTNPSDFCYSEYPEYLHTDENGNCSTIGIFDIPKKKHFYYCIEYPDIYIKGYVEK